MLHRGLCKAESSLAIQLCTEKIGVAALPHARRVPDMIFPGVSVREDPKVVIMFWSESCAQS